MHLTPVLARLLRTDRGAAAVEFAFILPLLVLFGFGTAEIGRVTLLALKLQHAATVMADLAARDEQLEASDLRTMFEATRHIVQPFDLADQGVVIVSAVGDDAGASPKVVWQEKGAGGLAHGSEIGAVGSTPSLPQGLVLRDGDTIIVAEVYFACRHWLLGLVGDRTIRRVAFYRPRLGNLRSLL